VRDEFVRWGAPEITLPRVSEGSTTSWENVMTNLRLDAVWMWQQLAVFDVVPQVLHQIRVGIIGHDNFRGSLDGAYEAGETGTSAQL